MGIGYLSVNKFESERERKVVCMEVWMQERLRTLRWSLYHALGQSEK